VATVRVGSDLRSSPLVAAGDLLRTQAAQPAPRWMLFGRPPDMPATLSSGPPRPWSSPPRVLARNLAGLATVGAVAPHRPASPAPTAGGPGCDAGSRPPATGTSPHGPGRDRRRRLGWSRMAVLASAPTAGLTGRCGP
jgi:hypothetical protein